MNLLEAPEYEESIFERMVRAGVAREYISTLDNDEIKAMQYDWEVFRRPKQTAPESDWRIWLILAGRGFGKTRTGAEYVRAMVNSNRIKQMALVGRTAADVRDTMIEGDSGILSICPKHERPRYIGSKRRLTWENGARAICYSAEEPDRLRGPNHDFAWCDELAAWRYPDTWDQLIFGLRVGENPRVIITTTPRPTPLMKRLVERDDVVITKGSTFDNRANLSPSFLTDVTDRYQGTRLGRQELYAEMLDDAEGALWTRKTIEDCRVTKHPPLKRVVVAIDPAASDKNRSSETGIIVAGLGEDGRGYVLDDKSIRANPQDWATEAVTAYHMYEADRIVAESNQGGDMITHTLKTVDSGIPIKLVHATRGKHTRAEPGSALYEQGKVSHVGAFPELEDQLCTWTVEGPSPDRLDALVWAFTNLMLDTQAPPVVVPFGSTQASPWQIN